MCDFYLECKVTQGQRSMCPSTEQCMGNIFVNRHPKATGDGLPAMNDFNFCDLEMTLKSHPRSKVMTHVNYVGHKEHFFVISTYGLRATVWPLRAILTFVALK